MTIKAVLFDLDDTLLWDERSIREAFAETCRAASERTGLAAEQLEASVRKEARALYESFETFDFTKMIGINPFEGLWGNFKGGEHPMFRKLQQLAPDYRRTSWTRGLAALGVNDPALGAELAELFPAKRRSLPFLYEETYDVLKELRGSYKLLLLTNGSPDLQQEKLDGVPELAPYFDEIVISGQFGEGKPSPRLFQHAMDKLGISAEEGVMVGDKLTTDIQGANGVGMASVWVNRHQIERSDEIVPSYEIASLKELIPLLNRLNG
ncbi:HAD family hydrolase [Cohnella lubricantis]|uniref:Phosphoserine phosphatase n=1 Tax=Cohnella lubricantis TaxID=2163172 RepID=A0A841TEB1_9BACL|nr:HAD family hydrolase [Cohnella lubricantis]MBB6679624.1 HAD family hydrolase [Cohnella lubricantis]MBP2118602.1 putative hydrolase of the HAD superfamily [Cohnella lubricantis]